MPRRREKHDSELTQKLLRVLDSQRRLGEDTYPLTLRRLVELAGERNNDPAIKSAVAAKVFKAEAIVAKPRASGKQKEFLLDSPTSLVGDIPRLAESALLLDFSLRVARAPKTHAFTVVQLRNGLTGERKGELQKAFQKSLEHRIEERKLPSSLGWVLIKGRRHLFQILDVEPVCAREKLSGVRGSSDPSHRSAVPSVGGIGITAPPAESPSDFATSFDEAFSRLDRQNGSRNFLKLHAVRQALEQFGRVEFDAGLRQLRLAGKYTLDSAEGRYETLSGEEREAGISEAGSLLIYVSRK